LVRDGATKGKIIVIGLIFILLGSAVPGSKKLIFQTNEVASGNVREGTEEPVGRVNYDDEAVKAAIERGLVFLNDSQAPDGGWVDVNYNKNANTAGNCLRAFIGYDPMNPRWQDAIEGAVRFLRYIWHDPDDYPAGPQRDYYGGLINNDRFNPQYTHAPLYSHGAATAALIDYYQHTGNSSILPYINASLELIIRAQNSPRKPSTLGGPRTQGGWRYNPSTTSSDTSASGWNIHALVLAESSMIFDVPDDSFEYAERWLMRCSNGSGFGYTSASPIATCTAVGTYCMYLMGKGNDPAAQGARSTLLNLGPKYDLAVHYYTYHATLAMYLAGGEEWEDWNEGVREGLILSQRQDGSWSGVYGTCWGTAMALMTLELCLSSIRAVLEPGRDLGSGEGDELVKLVEPKDDVTFNITVSLKPPNIEIPLSGPGNENKRVNITISEPLPGWKVDLETSTPGDGITLPDESKLWWVDIGLYERSNIQIKLSAPETGEWKELCSIKIDATIGGRNGNVISSIMASAVLDLDMNFSVDISYEVDDFLGVKLVPISPGEMKTCSFVVENIGNVNDTYHLTLDYDVNWSIYFVGSGMEQTVSLSTMDWPNNSTTLNLTVKAPSNALQGDVINVTIIAESTLHQELRSFKKAKRDTFSLLVGEPALQLICSNVDKRIHPGGSVDLEISILNNFRSPLDAGLSFISDYRIIRSVEKDPNRFTGDFLDDPIVIPSFGEFTTIFRIHAPENVIGGALLAVNIIGEGWDSIGNTFLSNFITIRVLVNHIPTVTLGAPTNETIITEDKITLNWTCEDTDDKVENISFDLYFGKNSEPDLYMKGIRENSFNIERLDDDTTYYWSIIPSDLIGRGICLGGVRNFVVNTTYFIPRVFLRYPENCSTIDDLTVNLSWVVRGPAVEDKSTIFNVYLGTSSDNLFITGITHQNNFELSDMENDTTYYWTVIPYYDSKEYYCNSGIWSFHTNWSVLKEFSMHFDTDGLEIMQGESGYFNLSIINEGNSTQTIYILPTGVLGNHVTVSGRVVLGAQIIKKINVRVDIPINMKYGDYDLEITTDSSIGYEILILPVTVINNTKADIGANSVGSEKTSKTGWIWILLAVIVFLVTCCLIYFIKIMAKRRRESREGVVEYVPDLGRRSHTITSKDWGNIKPRVPLKTGEKTYRRLIRVREIRKPRRLKHPIQPTTNGNGTESDLEGQK